MAKYLAKLEFMEFCYFCYNSHDANDFVVYKRIIDAENKGNARIEARRIKDSLSDDYTSHISTSLDQITEEEAIGLEQSRVRGQQSLIEGLKKLLS